MTKSIHTLIPDIYDLIGGPNGITGSLPSDLGVNVQNAVQQSLAPQERRNLRMSGLGDKCPCALWYSIHHPELAEPLPPAARIKYCYGHIIEHLVIGLIKAAGHTVEGEQDEISLDGILGHRDCIVDGCIVDVKSAATRSFLKFKAPASDPASLAHNDSFGYLAQLDAYVLASADDRRVTTKDRGYFLAVDKQLGHLALYEHTIRAESIRERIRRYKLIVNEVSAPPCTCGVIPDGKSGNLRLDVKASYSPYKHCCFPRLRTFLYSSGPVYLTKVVRKPDVTEVDKHGNYVYNGI